MQDHDKFDGDRLDFNAIKKVSLILRTLNNKVCQRIFELLATKRELTVTEIYSSLDLDQSVASMHLAKMRRHRIVTTKRNGKNILYGLDSSRLLHLHAVLTKLSETSIPE